MRITTIPVMLGLTLIAWIGMTPIVHASIWKDWGDGYQAGKDQALADYNAGNSKNDTPPWTGESNTYYLGYTAGYDYEWWALTQATP